MKLADWISEKRGRASELARALNVRHSTVLRWADGTHSPTLQTCADIERATDGAVRPQDFLPPAVAA